MNHKFTHPKNAGFYAPIALIIGASTLISCKVGRNYQQPDMRMPATYSGAAAQPAATSPATQSATQKIAPSWWRIFNDPDLTRIQEAAIAGNPDLKAAVARVAQARAAAGMTRAEFYPMINFDPSVTRARTISRTGSSAKAHTGTTTSIPFDLSYEIDIWGRVGRSMENAEAQVAASESSLGVVLLTMQADIAQNYFTLRSLDEQDEIISGMIGVLRHELSLFERQRNAGIINDLEIAQAQAQLQSEIAQQAEIRRQRAATEHAIALLTGAAPSELSLSKRSYAFSAPAVPPGLPADLLRRRPDIAAAEQNLIAANAQVGVAKADFYPTLRLTGAAGFESADLKSALNWENRVWSIGPSVTVPLFEGGRLSAQLAQTKARYDELTHTFRSTILTALREVEDSLTDLHHRAIAAAAQGNAVDASRQYLRISEIQYKAGTSNYLVVLDANRTLLSNQISAVQIDSQRAISTVLLIKALGGGWSADDAQSTAATQPTSAQPR